MEVDVEDLVCRVRKGRGRTGYGQAACPSYGYTWVMHQERAFLGHWNLGSVC